MAIAFLSAAIPRDPAELPVRDGEVVEHWLI
jgi:hypothetical protein